MRNIIKSDLNTSNIYRIREASFDASVVESDKSSYIPGLFSYVDVISHPSKEDPETTDISISSDVWEIRDKTELPPTPLQTKSLSFMPGFISERPSFLLGLLNNETEYDSEFYPMQYSLQYANVSDYMRNTLSKPVMMIDTISGVGKEFFGRENIYSREVTVSFRGASPGVNDTTKNLIYYDNVDTESSRWSKNWHPEADSDTIGLFISYDTVKIQENTPSYFSKTLYLEPGKYCFSFYSRFVDEIEDNLDERRLENYIGSVSVSLSNDLGMSFSKTFNDVSTFWKRYYVNFTIPGTEGLEVETNLNIEVGSSRLPFKVSSLFLQRQDYPSPYDRRWVQYENNNSSNSVRKIYYPLVFKSNKLKMDSSWTIIYKRFLEVPSESDKSFVDKIGDVIFGYKSGDFIVNGTVVPIKYYGTEEDVDISGFVNHTETVFLIYDEEKLKLRVFSSLDKSYEVDLPLTSIESEDDGIVFNLLLGGTTLTNGDYGYYKDMCISPFSISDELIYKIVSSFFDAFILSEYEYDRDYFVLPQSSDTKTWEEFLALESAEQGYTFTLSEDSPEEYSYHKGDMITCIKDISGRIEPKEIRIYWTRTRLDTYRETIFNQSVFRSADIKEGYIGV